MTINDLIDYLRQFPGDTRVLLNADDANALPDDAPHVALDVLDYSDAIEKATKGT